MQSSIVYNAGVGSTLMPKLLPLSRGRLDVRRMCVRTEVARRVRRVCLTKMAFMIGAVLSISTILFSVLRVKELPLTPQQVQAIAQRGEGVAQLVRQRGKEVHPGAHALGGRGRSWAGWRRHHGGLRSGSGQCRGRGAAGPQRQALLPHLASVTPGRAGPPPSGATRGCHWTARLRQRQRGCPTEACRRHMPRA